MTPATLRESGFELLDRAVTDADKQTGANILNCADVWHKEQVAHAEEIRRMTKGLEVAILKFHEKGIELPPEVSL